MYKLILFSVLIIICTIRSAIGQNYLIEKEESTFHGSAQLTSGSFERTITIQPGYTWNGRITAGVDFGKGTDNILGQTLNIVRPNLKYLIVKQNSEGSPLSFNLEAAYQLNILPATPANSRSVQLGASIYHQIHIKDQLVRASLTPLAGILAVQTTNKNGFQVENGLAIIYNFGFNILWEHAYLEPTVLINSGNISYALKVGYIL